MLPLGSLALGRFTKAFIYNTPQAEPISTPGRYDACGSTKGPKRRTPFIFALGKNVRQDFGLTLRSLAVAFRCSRWLTNHGTPNSGESDFLPGTFRRAFVEVQVGETERLWEAPVVVSFVLVFCVWFFRVLVLRFRLFFVTLLIFRSLRGYRPVSRKGEINAAIGGAPSSVLRFNTARDQAAMGLERLHWETQVFDGSEVSFRFVLCLFIDDCFLWFSISFKKTFESLWMPWGC